MRKLFILFFIVFMTGNYFGQQDYEWTGVINNSASTAGNWNNLTTSDFPALTAPQTGDNVIFDGGVSSVNCLWDDFSNMDAVNNLYIINSYSGLVDLTGGPLVIYNELSMGSGTLSSGGLTFYLNNGQFNLNGGTFLHNNNDVTVSLLVASSTFEFSGSVVLDRLVIDPPSAAPAGNAGSFRTINFGAGGITVNTLRLNLTSKIHAFSNTIRIRNELNMAGITYVTQPNSNNTGSFVFDGTGASLIGTTTSNAGPLPSVQINTTGTYSITNRLRVHRTWTASQGTLVAGTSTLTMSGTSVAAISGTAAAFDNLILSGTHTFPSAEVKIGRNFTRTGTVSNQTAALLGFNGGGVSQIMTGSLTPKAIRLYSGSTLGLASVITIQDSIKVESGATLTTGGNLILASTSALKGRVAEIGSGGSISGNVTARTFVPGPLTGWANWGSNGVNGQTIANWESQIPMTCTNCPNGPMSAGGYFVSIQGWDEPTSTYNEGLTTSTALTPGTGFWVYVGTGLTTTSDITLANTGALTTGPVNVGLTSLALAGADKGFNLVANPFASPVRWSRVLAASSNVGASIYAFNADLNAYTSHVSGVGTGGSAGISDVIPQGQGFYVEATFPVATLTFPESSKVSFNTSANPLTKPSQSSTDPNVGKVMRLKLTGANNDADDMAFRVHPMATSFYDKQWDAHKIFRTTGYLGYPGSYSKYTTISSKDAMNEDYSVHSFAEPQQDLHIPVLVRGMATGNYTITASETESMESCVMLLDKLTNTLTDLKSAGSYVFQLNDTTSTPRFELILCKGYSSQPVGIEELNGSTSVFINQDADGAYVNTDFPQNTKATISAYNIMGQKIMEDVKVEGTATSTRLNLNLHNQVVIIKVASDNSVTTKKIIAH